MFLLIKNEIFYTYNKKDIKLFIGLTPIFNKRESIS
jgi:hypothetical protein